MKMRTLVLGVVAALAALPALAADIDGRWNANVDTPQGAISLVFEFKADGEKLAGTMSNDMMGSIAIAEGSVKGDAVSFKLTIEGGPGGALTISYQGTLQGDELKLISTFDAGQGGPMETALLATRAK